MLAISNQTLAPGETATQQMRVMAPKGVSRSHACAGHQYTTDLHDIPLFQSQVRLRLRVGFDVGGTEVQDQVDFASFPADLMA